MKKQLYPISKTDWCVSWGRKSTKKGGPKFSTTMKYFTKRKDAMDWIKTRKGGYIQLFKMSYEFRNVWVLEAT